MYVVSVSYIICYITYDILFPKRGEGGEMEWARIFPNSKIDNRRKGREGDKKKGGFENFPSETGRATFAGEDPSWMNHGKGDTFPILHVCMNVFMYVFTLSRE